MPSSISGRETVVPSEITHTHTHTHTHTYNALLQWRQCWKTEGLVLSEPLMGICDLVREWKRGMEKWPVGSEQS